MRIDIFVMYFFTCAICSFAFVSKFHLYEPVFFLWDHMKKALLKTDDIFNKLKP